MAEAVAAGARARGILASSALYGLADMLVLAVGGFLLLPLYTRALTQADFGRFVIVKANLDLLTTVAHFGLASAASRLYFDHRREGRAAQYMGGVLTLFGVLLAALLAVLALLGQPLWQWLTPEVPAWPYLGWCVLLAAVAFLSSLGTTWLRLDGQPLAFAGVQLLAAGVLVVVAFLGLQWLHLGLTGVLLALLSSSVVGALALPAKFGRQWPLGLDPQQARETLHYALPALSGLLAYFVLNRINTLILQRHVGMEQIAVFGLAQQLGMLVTVAATALGKAPQPPVWGADARHAPMLIQRMVYTLLGVMLGVVTLILLFAAELLALVAPQAYQAAQPVMLMLVLATFGYALSLGSNTVLVYFRRPRLSAAITIAGASLCTLLGLWLIPRHGTEGAAMAMLGAFTAVTLLSYALARRLGGPAYLGALLGTMAAAAAVAGLAAWLHGAGLPVAATLGLKLAAATAMLGLAARTGTFKTRIS